MNILDTLKNLRARRDQAAAGKREEIHLTNEQSRARALDDDDLLDKALAVVSDAQEAIREKNTWWLENLQTEGTVLMAELDRRGLVKQVASMPAVPKVASGPVLSPVVSAESSGKSARELQLEAEIADVKAERQAASKVVPTVSPEAARRAAYEQTYQRSQAETRRWLRMK